MFVMKRVESHILFGTVALAVALLAGCGGEKPAAGGAGGAAGGPAEPAGKPPPAEVGVITVKRQPVALATELPGRLEATRVAQVRARVAGIVDKRLFTEGGEVKSGQVLYRIESAPYQAAAASARANLARVEATLTQARSQAERYKPLIEANAISKQEFINAVAAQKTAEADVASARASIQTAQINLSYATVTAPISGRIGRSLVTEGALVGQGDTTPLATIQQIDPMYVNFTQSTTDLLRLRRAVADGQYKRAGGEGASVRVLLEDGTPYDRPGKLLFSDVSVDPATGQITLRAEVPNPAGVLLPGMYVRVKLEQARAEDGIVLPQQAVTRGGAGDSVMVVGEGGKVSPRPVKIGSSIDGQWIVLDGLKEGEQVMVDGFQKLRGDAPVKPVPWKPSKGDVEPGTPKTARAAEPGGSGAAPTPAAEAPSAVARTASN